MSVPGTWTWRPPAEVSDAPGLLVSLVQGSPDKGEIRVTVDDVPRELSPAEWAMIELSKRGHALWAKREAHTPIGVVADLLTRAEGPDGGVIARTNMAKDGRRIFTITCQAPHDEYPTWASDFGIALATFRLLHPGPRPLAEQVLMVSYLYPAVIGFSHPVSWVATEEADTESECLVRLDDLEADRVVGSMTMHARSETKPDRLVSRYFKRLAQAGVTVDTVPAGSPAPPPEYFTKASMVRATGRSAEGDVDVRGMVLEARFGALLLVVNGPTRERSALPWAIHQRAYEIALDTLFAI
jgi:hypothetical protein